MKERLSILNETDKAALERVVRIHEQEQEVQAIAIVGSISRGLSTYHDVDLLVLHNSTDSDMRSKFAENLKHDQPYILDDTLRFSIQDNHEMSLAYKNIQDFTDKVQGILEGKEFERVVKNWAVGGFISETLLADISKAIVLFDKQGSFSSLIDSLIKYPERFRSLLITFLEDELNQKLAYLENRPPFVKIVASVDVQIAALRLIFALKSEFFPGFKHVESASEHWNQEELALLRGITALDTTNPDFFLFEKLIQKAR